MSYLSTSLDVKIKELRVEHVRIAIHGRAINLLLKIWQISLGYNTNERNLFSYEATVSRYSLCKNMKRKTISLLPIKCTHLFISFN